MGSFEVELLFHERTDEELARIMREAARNCPRCPSCGHHPNAHASGTCSVTVERPSNKQAKCGCSLGGGA